MVGHDRPKQYLPLLDHRTLLGQTLDRVSLAIPPARTAVVTLRSHARYFPPPPPVAASPHVLVQPGDRGTAAGILFPVHWIFWHQPDAVVAIFPSDHFVSAEGPFMAQVARISAWVDQHPERLVLLGARATEAEVEYGWIEPGGPLSAPADFRVWEISRFWEKPSEERARRCLAAGCLWNTFILVGKAATFIRAGREALPAVHDRLARITPFLGTADAEWALHQAYALMPKANFSRSILEPCPDFLAVSDIPEVTWSDLGSPRRVFEALKRSPSLPTWVASSDIAGPGRQAVGMPGEWRGDEETPDRTGTER
jgi:mannose-1-phosphate guanylyltransferase